MALCKEIKRDIQRGDTQKVLPFFSLVSVSDNFYGGVNFNGKYDKSVTIKR